ncbi:hypothetical protein HPB48_022020 [Haemaphysalis longicornis]|uniref:Uncharacterized protein n=1 Tax=Haemaphysalis longicornis TaxID=44386 RepID=A0A9J6H4U2_HAELO|nr:hypothetical protein HPB48_022020 [Haemaphysalis longicornis]
MVRRSAAEEVVCKVERRRVSVSRWTRFVVALEPGERLPYKEFQELSCILVGVNDTAIDEAEDSFRQCDNPAEDPHFIVRSL